MNNWSPWLVDALMLGCCINASADGVSWQEREGCPAHQPQRKQQTDKQERFEQAKALRLRGLSQREIAGRLALGVRTVQRGPGRETNPASQPRRKRRSIFDPYAPYVLSRWQQGERSVSLLWQEIQDQGFKGSLHTMYRFVKALRQESVSLPAPSVLDRVAVQKAIWLLARPYEKLKANERTDLQELCQASQELAALHALVQAFGQMVRERDQHRLQDWMKQVAESDFRDVKRFAEAIATGQRRSPCRVNTGLFQRAGGRPDQQTQTHQKTRLWQSWLFPPPATRAACAVGRAGEELDGQNMLEYL